MLLRESTITLIRLFGLVRLLLSAYLDVVHFPCLGCRFRHYISNFNFIQYNNKKRVLCFLFCFLFFVNLLLNADSDLVNVHLVIVCVVQICGCKGRGWCLPNGLGLCYEPLNVPGPFIYLLLLRG